VSWLKIDDGFEDHPKVEPISDAAHRLWTRAACWCQKTGSDGFVPRAMLLAISKNAAPLKRLERLAQELVDARAGGVFESGLWEIVDGGWKFHDWDEYQPESKPPEDKPEPMSRSDAARAAGLRSAQVRRERHGTAQPSNFERSARTSTERPPNDVRTLETRSTERRSEVFDRTNAERSRTSFEPPDPDPDPDLAISKEEAVVAEDLTGIPREEPPRQRPQPRQDSRRERSRTELSDLPIDELAKRWRENPAWVAESSPQSRPELIAAAKAWDEAVGLAPRALGHAGKDSGTRALLDLYADGVPHADIMRACAQAKHDDWICGRAPGRAGEGPRKRRIDCLSHAVLRRLLDAADAARPSSVNPKIAAILEAERKRELEQRA
jgi:hypothetical protein